MTLAQDRQHFFFNLPRDFFENQKDAKKTGYEIAYRNSKNSLKHCLKQGIFFLQITERFL